MRAEAFLTLSDKKAAAALVFFRAAVDPDDRIAAAIDFLIDATHSETDLAFLAAVRSRAPGEATVENEMEPIISRLQSELAAIVGEAVPNSERVVERAFWSRFRRLVFQCGKGGRA